MRMIEAIPRPPPMRTKTNKTTGKRAVAGTDAATCASGCAMRASRALKPMATPAGMAIGFNARLARIAQPLAQVAASVPATALFPVVLLVLVRIGGGLGIASIILMLLGTQWYILFNVIAGAT